MESSPRHCSCRGQGRGSNWVVSQHDNIIGCSSFYVTSISLLAPVWTKHGAQCMPVIWNLLVPRRGASCWWPSLLSPNRNWVLAKACFIHNPNSYNHQDTHLSMWGLIQPSQIDRAENTSTHRSAAVDSGCVLLMYTNVKSEACAQENINVTNGCRSGKATT